MHTIWFYTICFKRHIEINFFATALKNHTIKFFYTIEIRIFMIEFKFSTKKKLRMIIKFYISTKSLMLSLFSLLLLLPCSNIGLLNSQWNSLLLLLPPCSDIGLWTARQAINWLCLWWSWLWWRKIIKCFRYFRAEISAFFAIRSLKKTIWMQFDF